MVGQPEQRQTELVSGLFQDLFVVMIICVI